MSVGNRLEEGTGSSEQTYAYKILSGDAPHYILRGWQISSVKGRAVDLIRFCRPYRVCHYYPALLLCAQTNTLGYKYGSQFDKTLFTNSRWADSAHGLSLPVPTIDGRPSRIANQQMS